MGNGMTRVIRISNSAAFSSDVLLRIVIAGTRLPPRTAVEPGVYDFSEVPTDVWESCVGTVSRRLQDLRDRGLCA